MAQTLLEQLRYALKLRLALAIVWRHTKAWCLVSAVLIVLQSALPAASLYALKLLVDAVGEALTAPAPASAPPALLWLVLLLGLLGLARAALNSFNAYVRECQSYQLTVRLHNIIHQKAAAADLAWFENAHYADTLHRAQTEVGYRPTNIINDLSSLFQNVFSLLGLMGLLFSLNWYLAPLVLLTTLPEILVRFRFTERLYAWTLRRTTDERKAWFYHWMLTTEEHAEEIRQFHLGPHFTGRYLEIEEQLYREKKALLGRRSRAEMGARVLSSLAITGAYAFLGFLTLAGGITIGAMVMFYQAFQQAQEYFQDLMRNLAGLYEDNRFLFSLYDILDTPNQIVDPPDPLPFPARLEQGIRFQGVDFVYPGCQQPALRQVDLTIRPGIITAIVGENGSGKTTLIKLLGRMYDPTRGAVTFDGIDARRFRVLDLRGQVSVIFQDFGEYPFSARDNVWFGDIGQDPQSPQVRRALDLAGAGPLVDRLPAGIETILSKWLEEGVELSVGEWQKIALARALFRRAQVLVLDEPTSAIDAKSEYEFFSQFKSIARGKTVILISHRFSTVRMAEAIYVVDKGRITEQGTHEQLLALDGTYAQLYNLQTREIAGVDPRAEA